MDIVLRALVVFIFLWAITRLVGRSTLGELSSFELILFVCMGDLIAQGVTQQDYSITGAVLAVGTMALLTIVMAVVNARWGPSRVTHGVPIVIVADGEPVLETMKQERLSYRDLMAAARGQGLQDIDQVRLAVLEANGQISFLQASAAE